MTENHLFFKESVKKSFFEAKKHADRLEKKIKENRELISLQNKQIEALIEKVEHLKQEIAKISPNSIEKNDVPEEEKGSIHTYIHTLNTYTHPKHTLKTLVDNIEKLLNSLTKQELLTFLTIYQLEEDLKRPVTYAEISKKLELSEGCIRTYIRSMIQKGTPLVKKKQNNKTVFLSILEDFRNLNYKEKIISAYYGTDPDQKRLF